MKTLNDIAIKFAELAFVNISTKGLQTYAVKTGNLRDRVKAYNTPQKMITQKPSKSPTKFKAKGTTDFGKVSLIAYQFAPPGATYGKWVEWGNGTYKGKGNPRPFAGNAANSPEMKKEIKEYQAYLASLAGQTLAAQVNQSAKKIATKK